MIPCALTGRFDGLNHLRRSHLRLSIKNGIAAVVQARHPAALLSFVRGVHAIRVIAYVGLPVGR
jgi:hypothetical protein